MAVTMRASTLAPQDDALTGRVIGAAIEVHKALGPGLLEAIYQNALCVELANAGLTFDREYRCSMFYAGTPVGEQRLDLVVDHRVVVEMKAVDALSSLHRAQLRTYLKATRLTIGLLLNFGAELIQVKRVLNTPNNISPTHRSPDLPS